MKSMCKAALAALLAASATMAVAPNAHAQIVGDPNTSVTGEPIYIEEEDVDVTPGTRGSLTINGAMGLPLNPTANMPAQGTARVQGNYYKLWSNDTLAEADSKLYGIYVATALSDRIEVHAGFEKQDVSADGLGSNSIEEIGGSGAAFGVKYLLNKPSSARDARLAIGAGYSKALYKNTYAYLVASKGFGARNRIIQGHIGVRYDRFEVDDTPLTDKASSSQFSGFIGAEIPIDERGRFSLVGELQTKNAKDELGGAMPYSVSLRYQNGDGLSASFGMMRQGVLSEFVTEDRGLFAQVGKTF